MGEDCVEAPNPVQGTHQPSPRLFVLQWHITEECNLHCRHCYQESSTVPDLTFSALLSILEQFKNLLDRLGSETAPHPFRAQVNVTGGEPFFRRDFFDLLEVFRENREHFSFGILTNGTLIDKTVARRLASLKPQHVQVSMEGSQSTNDAIRGNGAFDDTVRALKCLIREGIHTSVSFTAHKDNFREFPAVARLARELGVTQVWADRLIPCGNGLTMGGGSLTPEEAREFFKIMCEARGEAERVFCRTTVAVSRALQFLAGGGQTLPLPCRREPGGGSAQR